MIVNVKTAAAAVVASAALVATPVLAANQGQIEGGDIYRVKNITQNRDFSDPQTAKACDTLQYKVRIHNPGPGALSQVNVKATLPSNAATSNTSTVTVSSQSADPSSTSDNAVVNFTSGAQSETYVSGSTQLLDANGNVIQNLSDGITAGGVNIGNVGVSIEQKRFVQFKAQVNCPTEQPKQPEQPGKGAPAPEQPAALPETGPEAGLAALAGSGALGYAVREYRRSRKSLANKLRQK